MSVQTDYYIPQMKIQDEQISKQAAEISRLRAALAPFAADRLPSSRRTEIAYNRDGLRCAMSPLQIAQTAAYSALSQAEREAET